MDRVSTLVAISIGGLTVVLGLVTWWVIRLGITPIKRMTNSATAIAAGDLSERVADINRHTEAGQLGYALNTMLGNIESSIAKRERAEQKLRQFIADASHELRTPIATIRGYAELYEDNGLTSRDDLDDAMRRTRQESERMTRLVNDMLALAKLDHEPQFKVEPVDITAIAQDCVLDARASHPQRTININRPDSGQIVDGDPDLIAQAFNNLIGNALDHTDTPVDVTVSETPTGPSFTVSDTGDGMNPEDTRRATERFYRADKARSRNRGGSGLGLSIVQSIADAHDATLDVRSAPKEGTSISLKFHPTA